jgi:endonuclease/exonuclease/phosphatase family metal-dependent hydrolase
VKAGGSASTTYIGITVERLLVRTWNVFHGNANPPERRAFLEEAVHLAVEDDPDVVCLQELPVWALDELEDWSGMTAVGDVAQAPRLGPLPSTAEIGRVLTDLDHALLRSAFTGQANAVLLSPQLRAIEHRQVALNPYAFRRAQGRRLGLGILPRLAWAKERRVCQALRVVRGGETLVLANVHVTGSTDKRIPDAELLRAAVFVDGMARPDEPIVLVGDFNLTVRNSTTLPALVDREWSFTGATAVGIDHVLVRGLDADDPVRWPRERRTRAGRVLSDHAPVDREVR